MTKPDSSADSQNNVDNNTGADTNPLREEGVNGNGKSPTESTWNYNLGWGQWIEDSRSYMTLVIWISVCTWCMYLNLCLTVQPWWRRHKFTFVHVTVYSAIINSPQLRSENFFYSWRDLGCRFMQPYIHFFLLSTLDHAVESRQIFKSVRQIDILINLTIDKFNWQWLPAWEKLRDTACNLHFSR